MDSPIFIKVSIAVCLILLLPLLAKQTFVLYEIFNTQEPSSIVLWGSDENKEDTLSRLCKYEGGAKTFNNEVVLCNSGAIFQR